MKKVLVIMMAVLCSSVAFGKKKIARPNSYNYERGVQALMDDDFEEGFKYLNKELEDNPKNGYAFYWIAAGRNIQSEYGKAITAVNLALKYLPKKDVYYLSSTYALRGNVYLELEDTLAAMKDFDMAIKLEPTNTNFYEYRADLFFELGDLEASSNDYRKLIELDEGEVWGYMGLGRNLKMEEDYAKAIELFSRVIKMRSDYSSGYSFRAECLLKQGKYRDAIDDIFVALEINEDRKAFYMLFTEFESEELMNLLKAKFQLKRNEEPNNVYWYYYWAMVLQNNKNYLDAIEQYNGAKKVSASSLLDQRIAECYSGLGDYVMALEYVNKAIAADSTLYDLYSDRACYNAELGNREAALVDLDKYVEEYPDYYNAYHQRAWYKQLDRQYEAAVEDYTLSITLNEYDVTGYASRGRCYLALGKEELAKADFEKVLEVDSLVERSAQTAFAYHHLGQDSLAIEWIKRVLETDSTEYYNAACVYALVKDVDNALAYLRLAFENGFVGLHHITIDPDFDGIRDLPEFQALLDEYTEKIQANWHSKKQEMVRGEVRVVEVPFSPAGGVTTVKCAINGLPLTFIFDTGASSVSLSKVEADFMYKNGYLTDKDIVGKQYFQTADGNISVGTVINLKEIVFGGLTLTNVRASVTQSQSAPLLLGQSVLQRLGKIEIDNEKRVLKISTTENVVPVAEEIVEEAVEDVISNATDEIEELVTEEETEVVETLAAEDIVVEVIEEPTTVVVATEEDEEPVVVVEPTVEEVIESTVEETVPEVVEEGVEIVE